MYSYRPPHMAGQKLDDQLEHTFISYVRIRGVALKTCQRRWTIGRSGERGSGISVLAARHDDDDDDHYLEFGNWSLTTGCSLISYLKHTWKIVTTIFKNFYWMHRCGSMVKNIVFQIMTAIILIPTECLMIVTQVWAQNLVNIHTVDILWLLRGWDRRLSHSSVSNQCSIQV